jgi:TPR repeat protein
MENGDIHGMFCYATMLEHGRGIAKDEVKAAQLYKRAADAGHDRAQSEYGMLCEFGRSGVPKSQQEAVRYYRMASDQGSPHGMICFADMLGNGIGVPKDTNAAHHLYRLAAERAHPKALGCLGSTSAILSGFSSSPALRRRGTAGAPDLSEAYRYYAMAAARGIASATLRMARMMMLGHGTAQSVIGALDMYNTMIERAQNTDAMTQLGVHFLQGEGVQRDADRGIDLLRRAALLGNTRAQQHLNAFGSSPMASIRRFFDRLLTTLRRD